MALIDNAVYVAGRRVESPSTLSLATRGDLAWIGLFRPDDAELEAVAVEFDLHENAVETPARATSAPSSSATATRSSSCCARRGSTPGPRPSSSARCTCSSATGSS